MNSKLKIYFYHTRLTRESYEEWKDFRFPGHILYGLPLLEKHGIQSVMHRYKPYANRWKLMLYTTKEILFCKEKYEVLYGTSFRGLELIRDCREMLKIVFDFPNELIDKVIEIS